MATEETRGGSLTGRPERIGLNLLRSGREAQPQSQAEAPIASWIERLLAPYLQSLGNVGALLPRVLERVAQIIDSPTGEVVLFRARSPYEPTEVEKDGDHRRGVSALGDRAVERELSVPETDFYEFIASFDTSRSVVTESLALQLDRIKSRKTFAEAGHALDDLTANPHRLELPRLLEELKHEVRANRAQGFVKVHAELQWLLEADGRNFRDAYALLERLTDELGEACLRRIRRHPRALKRLLEAGSLGDTKVRPLRDCFASFGYRLGDRISVIPCGSELRQELLVMDHDHDRCFEIRQEAGSTIDRPWRGAQVVGVEAGRDYPFADHEIKLPLRVHDAAQGMALWSVDLRLVQESPELFPSVAGVGMRAWDTGANRTPVAVFFAHFRDTDIGEYYEIGLACFVAPLKDPLSVGVVTLGSMPVSAEAAQKFGRNTWGYPKEYVPRDRWAVQFRPNHVECKVTLDHGEEQGVATVELRLPRGGASSSSSVPVLLYTRKPTRDGMWLRSAMMRFARGESVRIAGSGVKLSVVLHKQEEAFRHPLVKELFRLGLVDRAGHMQAHTMLAAWSENVNAQLGAGTPVLPPEPQFD